MTDELGSPAWWVSAVVVGIAINIASAYLIPPLDRLRARSSARWRKKSEARDAAWRDYVARLAGDDRELALAHSRMLAASINAVFYSVAPLSAVVLAVGMAHVLPKAAIVVAGSMYLVSGAYTIASLKQSAEELGAIRAANRVRQKGDPST